MFTQDSIAIFNFEEVEKLYQKLATLEWENLSVRFDAQDLKRKIQSLIDHKAIKP